MFARTEEMMKNSQDKLNVEKQTDEPVEQKYSLFSASNSLETEEDDVIEDDVKVNMKTALIAETYFGKRKKK